MITAYLMGTPSYYEGEDIEIRFHVFKDEEVLFKESFLKEYKKPAVVGHVALLELLKKLESFKESEITIVINDGALYEQIRGTSNSKNNDVIRMTIKVNEELKQFGHYIKIKDVSTNKIELNKWMNILGN